MINIAAFLADVRSWVGTPYHHQGRSRHGVDCIGLAIAALAQQHVAVNHSANYSRSAQGDALLGAIEASGMVRKLAPGAELAPGDILVFRIRTDPQHVAVALEDGEMIHADASSGVRVVQLSPLWAMRLLVAYRFN